MPQYEFWENAGAERYLIRLDAENQITGVCGPIRQKAIPAGNRHNFDYDAQPQYAAWIAAHRADFHGIDIS